MDTHSYTITFGSRAQRDECSVSESRMRDSQTSQPRLTWREIRLSGLDGGLLKYYSRSMEGGLP